ncbi:hypothetical protein P8452_25761 [Trifolium repens]|nr:hypothetical protein P8452_25761 [Trifolium repens]
MKLGLWMSINSEKCVMNENRNIMDSSGRHSDSSDRVRSVVISMEHCTNWIIEVHPILMLLIFIKRC